MKVLVTGARGFIGSHLVEALNKSGYSVKALIRPSGRKNFSPFLQDNNVEITYGDITNVKEVKNAVTDVNTVFHLAALLGTWKMPESEYYRVNAIGTNILLEQSLKANVDYFLFLSTTGVMGRLRDLPGNINSPCYPASWYEKSKYQAELKIRDAIRKKNFNATIIRATHVYGPGDKNTLKLFQMIKLLKVFPLVGGGNFFQPLHVKDLVRALIFCMEKQDATSKKLYLIAGDEIITFKEFVRMSAKKMHTRIVTLDVPLRLAWLLSNISEGIGTIVHHEPPLTRSRVEFFGRSHVYGARKIQRETGFRPHIDMITGLDETIGWYKEKGWL